LTVFVVKRDSMRCQRSKGIEDVSLRTDPKIGQIETDKVLDEVEDPIAWRHSIRALVKSIHDEINRRLF